ncbi:class I SAM-dependent DNA methyltransferase [Paenibacillus chondroitinus]|uniref:site-specific DNA-methyltransferase (adenine-specific) n=1 Tax=Paenibacillus chondroitinus TaxID=59842 RepID=A0ABU6DHH6_9BACL|nr:MULTISPECIES: class I SAM-dependent DNA methyltransferase [Paenibacillus]MCY9658507.1 type I restriction-modification system subunit M [Paenibacillus anseongense]MEB4797219.1 class I SAM-dependent DNA methyltransferase [Paenibacillus chondroitinus]
MLTGDARNRVNSIWEMFWTGGISNPLSVIEQFTYLLFIKQLDDQQIRQEKRARLSGKPLENPIFSSEQHNFRWSQFKNYEAGIMFETIKDEAFPHMKALGDERSQFTKHLENAVFIIPTPQLLQRVVTGIDQLITEISEKNKDTMGDLYEYLLSKIATSGTNGQFRTPRHIIRMMVELMKPSPQDTIVDPATGTAGFLVEAAEYVREHHRDELFVKSGNEELQAHFKSSMFHGFDTDLTMLRIAAMNLMLHGIEDPQILYQDSLSKGNTEVEKYSLVLANPPFKGSLDYSEVADNLLKKVKTKKTELLFLALMLRLLKNGGRCAVVVPDGVLFGSSKAHVDIRKEIIDNHKLEAIISMPSGVFKPYAGVSTAIMIFTKTNFGGTDQVWFYDMQADGYSLDDNRRELDMDKHENNNIPDIISRFSNLDFEKDRTRYEQSFFVNKEALRANNYDLSINRYKEQKHEEVVYAPPKQILQEVANLEKQITAGLQKLEEMLK